MPSPSEDSSISISISINVVVHKMQTNQQHAFNRDLSLENRRAVIRENLIRFLEAEALDTA